ncbi:Detected protein of unknown function [Hibiscus syriacus]|uniref:Uncharacterized protein n=1 Tax=Hibiscus syriacus TaxID=106335 RepID=A0A6A2Y170_HIBSY|nr:Detected protein of unknown function [Hibiscus syriacus]
MFLHKNEASTPVFRPDPETSSSRAYMKPLPEGLWTTGICECYGDAYNCLFTGICPCITMGQNSEIINRGEIVVDAINLIWDDFPYYKLHEQPADRPASSTLPQGWSYSDGYLGRETERSCGNTSRCRSRRCRIGPLTFCACGALFVKNTENYELVEPTLP